MFVIAPGRTHGLLLPQTPVARSPSHALRWHTLDHRYIKRAVRQVRAEGRLICDHPGEFASSCMSYSDEDGLTFVCALGAYDPSPPEETMARYPEAADICRKLMDVHDNLLRVRNNNTNRRYIRIEAVLDRELDALIAK